MRKSRRGTEEQADVLVVGLGAMGSSILLQLAKRGRRAVGIDRFHPPHDHGSTHGETRITRLALGEGSQYVPLVRRSHQLWREIERESNTELLDQTAGLVIGQRDNAFLEQTREAATAYGIVHENLSNAELGRRFPMFGPDRHTEAYLEPEAGFVRPEVAVRAQLLLAERAGAELRLGEAVISWSASSAAATVCTATSSLHAQELVLCAGAWLRGLDPDGADLFAVYPQVLHWFPIRRGYEALREMPVFIWETGGRRAEFAHATGFYGFPAIDGPSGGVKLATESYEATVDPDDLLGVDVDLAAAEFHDQLLARRFPWVGRRPLRSIPCLYTNTRGSRFIIDRHPAHANVTIVSACSGHGFKHSPAVGEAVAQIIADGASEIDLAPFRLRTPAPPSATPDEIL